MRLALFVCTLLFSVSVLADCCNFEFESPVELSSTLETEHHDDDCGDRPQHSESQHCHCSPINHFKIIPDHRMVMDTPHCYKTERIPSSESLLTSDFESIIFHPPIV